MGHQIRLVHASTTLVHGNPESAVCGAGECFAECAPHSSEAPGCPDFGFVCDGVVGIRIPSDSFCDAAIAAVGGIARSITALVRGDRRICAGAEPGDYWAS